MSNLNNPYDNSEQLAINDSKDRFQASETGNYSEIEQMKTYFEYLLKRSEVEKSDSKIKVGDTEIAINKLIPAKSQFEEERLRVLALCNRLGVEDPLVQSWMRDFGTNSVFELASAYANFSLGKTRGEKLYQVLHGKTASDAEDIADQSIYKSLLDDDDKKSSSAKKAIREGKISAGIGGKTRSV